MFLKWMSACKDEWMKLPVTVETLLSMMKDYEDNFRPGCEPYVVHLKWSFCPSGGFNRASGKEQYPIVSFKCVTDNKHMILGVAPVQFGAWNNKHIVHLDPIVIMITNKWYCQMKQYHYNISLGI